MEPMALPRKMCLMCAPTRPDKEQPSCVTTERSSRLGYCTVPQPRRRARRPFRTRDRARRWRAFDEIPHQWNSSPQIESARRCVAEGECDSNEIDGDEHDAPDGTHEMPVQRPQAHG